MASTLFDLTGKRVVITGATRGLGYAIAEQMGHAGGHIVVSSEVAADVDAAVTALQQAGITAHGVPCDVSDDVQLAALVEAARVTFGGIDVLVCNAGITGRPGPASCASTCAASWYSRSWLCR
jgi:NAD(P)-dependent dehydrogenase (short-subunit alcohol dehydrogenase family)